MSTEVKLPPIADGVEKADILAVLVKEGDEIEADATICEVEAEKATASVTAAIAVCKCRGLAFLIHFTLQPVKTFSIEIFSVRLPIIVRPVPGCG